MPMLLNYHNPESLWNAEMEQIVLLEKTEQIFCDKQFLAKNEVKNNYR